MKRIGLAVACLSLFVVGLGRASDGLALMAARTDDLLCASCRSRVVVAHHNVVVATPVFAASYVPYAVPSYGVSYSGGSQEQLIKFLIEQFKSQDVELKALRSDVQALRAGGGIGPLKTPEGDEPRRKGIGAFKVNCAGCHEATVAKGKGGGFVLFEGDALVKLTDKQIRNIQSRVTIADADQMPPPKSGKKMSDEHFGDIMGFLRTLE